MKMGNTAYKYAVGLAVSACCAGANSSGCRAGGLIHTPTR